MSEQEYKEIISVIYNTGEKLAQWEFNMILGLYNYDFDNIPPQQLQTLREIHDRRVNV